MATKEKEEGDESPMEVGKELMEKLGDTEETSRGLTVWDVDWPKVLGAVVSWAKDTDTIWGEEEKPNGEEIVDRWVDYLDERFGKATGYIIEEYKYASWQSHDMIEKSDLAVRIDTYRKKNSEFDTLVREKWETREIVEEEDDEEEEDEFEDGDELDPVEDNSESWRDRRKKQKLTGWEDVDTSTEESDGDDGVDGDNDDSDSVDDSTSSEWDAPTLKIGDPLVEIQDFADGYDHQFDSGIIPCQPWVDGERADELLGTLSRLISDGGILYVDCGIEPHGPWYDNAAKHFEVVQTIVWDTGEYGLGHVGGDTPQFRRGAKFILMCSNGEPDATNSKEKARNIIEVKEIDEKEKRHPDEKPTPLLHTLISAVTPVDGSIVVPYDYGAQVAYVAETRGIDYLSVTERKEDSNAFEVKLMEYYDDD